MPPSIERRTSKSKEPRLNRFSDKTVYSKHCKYYYQLPLLIFNEIAMEDAALFNPSSAVVIGTHLQPPRDQSRKRSSTGAKREQSESRKHLRPERDEAKEDSMVEEEDLGPVRAKVEKLKLERENRIVERQDIPRQVRKRVRFFCCSCEGNTGVEKGDTGEFECFSCKHTKCPACWV